MGRLLFSSLGMLLSPRYDLPAQEEVTQKEAKHVHSEQDCEANPNGRVQVVMFKYIPRRDFVIGPAHLELGSFRALKTGPAGRYHDAQYQGKGVVCWVEPYEPRKSWEHIVDGHKKSSCRLEGIGLVG